MSSTDRAGFPRDLTTADYGAKLYNVTSGDLSVQVFRQDHLLVQKQTYHGSFAITEQPFFSIGVPGYQVFQAIKDGVSFHFDNLPVTGVSP